MNTIRIVLVSFALAMAATSVFAHDDDDGDSYDPDRYYTRSTALENHIHALLERQHRHIERAVRKGNLRPKTARRLFHKHEKLVRQEDRFASDGYLSPYEARSLEQQIHRLDNKINRKIHHRRHWNPRRLSGWNSPYPNSRWRRCDRPGFRASSPYPSFYRPYSSFNRIYQTMSYSR